ncbi:MAG: cytochrome d ubiquinol oxidase subunit II [Actinomycetota bacterium]|nr:cytochrome d ubiquinol oxidase subunit II [Actinomycetota bacterium]
MTGGADFGGGIWDLIAGGTQRGSGPRQVIAGAMGPVWEANHVWLILDLVLLWTAFPAAFGAIMSALFTPLSLIALGIVLRGAGFAFRKSLHRTRLEQIAGAIFASSSLVTPFFFGAAAGAVVTGRVTAAGTGNRLASWTSPTCLLLGALAVAAFAYLAGAYLTVAASKRQPDLVRYFTRRALAAGVATGALGAASLVALHHSAPRTFSNLTTGDGLPLLIVSVLLGVTVLGLLLAGITRAVRFLAAGAFTAMIWGWGVAQYPDLLPGSLTLHAGAAPSASLITEIVIVGIVAVLVAPSFVLLYWLAQRNLLAEDDASGAALLASLNAAGQPGQAQIQSARSRWPKVTLAAVAVLVYEATRRHRR